MKKIIKIVLFVFIYSNVQGQDFQYNLFTHSSCITAKTSCGRVTISQTFAADSCQHYSVPQYFKFKAITPHQAYLGLNGTTGIYTLYGPMNSSGLDMCEQLSLGLVNTVSGSIISNNITIPHGTGFYILKVTPTSCINDLGANRIDISLSVTGEAYENICDAPPVDCADCISSFSPDPEKYLVSAWVKGEAASKNTSYQNPKLIVSFVNAPEIFSFDPSGKIIDDWQRIDGIVTIPQNATDIKIELHCQEGTCYFDDIRFVPVNGSMISYVYDPVNLRLVAQLDERNYATLYEYDEEGKLIRVKKETERGIMTIQENRDNIHKR